MRRVSLLYRSSGRGLESDGQTCRQARKDSTYFGGYSPLDVTFAPQPRTLVPKLEKHKMQDDEAGPSLSLGLFRLSGLFACVVIVIYIFWEMFSQSAALIRLSMTAKNFPYAERCDASGNPITTGEPNCVDLGYQVVYGPVIKVFRRACSGSDGAPETLILDKASRIEISLVEKSLSFRARNEVSVSCIPPNLSPERSN